MPGVGRVEPGCTGCHNDFPGVDAACPLHGDAVRKFGELDVVRYAGPVKTIADNEVLLPGMCGTVLNLQPGSEGVLVEFPFSTPGGVDSIVEWLPADLLELKVKWKP